MRRSSPYFNLRYIVECKPPRQAFFEQMCAFNSDSVAFDYAERCRADKRFWPDGKWEYRVMKRTNKGLVEMTKPESFA